ncbi:glutathione S-transferase T2-like [Eutrema salsugineum]|uniref:glutathione S-transferase T2-like n=1 Tax=Eutrema salsugineum TaxID=72664 RepID=UPI000CED062B|nr:glutathione S-transferase T2-like [Eutrema salsugineum]
MNDFVCKFCGAFEAATRDKCSGMNANDVIKMAHQIYFSDQKKKFNLEHAWKELRNDQKWSELSTTKTDPTSKKRRSGEVPNGFSYQITQMMDLMLNILSNTLINILSKRLINTMSKRLINTMSTYENMFTQYGEQQEPKKSKKKELTSKEIMKKGIFGYGTIISARQQPIRLLAYGGAADSVDEYLRLSETNACSCLENFVEATINLFGDEYLRRPTQEDLQRLLYVAEQRGFPGMIGSIDCMHWEWKNCPTAWKGQYSRGLGKPTIV